MKTTNVFDRTVKGVLDSSLIISYGGSGSGKTVAAMQLLYLLAAKKKDLIIFFFAQTVPKLKNTLIEDFKRYVVTPEYFTTNYHNQDSFLLIPQTNSKIIFTSADDPSKVVGVRSDYILFDEINTYRHGHDIFKNLFGRCRHSVIATFNPATKFWLADYFGEDYATVIHSTYLDNPYLPTQTLRNLLALSKKDENFKKVYLNGEWGALEGVVFKFKQHWNYFTEKPKNYDAKYYGGDFGYVNDPSTVVEVIRDGKNLYITEIFYKTNLSNEKIAELCQPLNSYIVFDSNEPKSIARLRKLKVKALTAVKGKDSVKIGIDIMRSYNLYLNIKSKNLINNFFNYAYPPEKNETIDNNPIKKNDHTIDAVRYVCLKYRL